MGKSVERKLGDSSMSEALVREEVMGLVSSAREIWLHGPLIESEAPLRRALKIIEERLGSGHFLAALVHVYLGWLASEFERSDEANESFGQSLIILKQQFEERHPDAIQTMVTLASVVGNYDTRAINADELIMALIDAYESEGREDGTLANLYAAAAVRRYWIGCYQEAEPLFIQALASQERWFGSDNYQSASTALWMAMMYHNGRIEGDPEPYYRKALAGIEASCGRDHAETNKARFRLARFLFERDGSDEAIALFNQVIAGLAQHESRHDLEHDHWMLDGCCRFLQATGRETEANDLLKRFGQRDMYLMACRSNAERREKQFGSNSLELAEELVHLAIAYAESNPVNPELAESTAIRSISIYEDHLGPEHEKTLKTVRILTTIRNRIQSKESMQQTEESPSMPAPGRFDGSQGKRFDMFTAPWNDERRDDLVRTYLKNVAEGREDDPTGAIGAIVFMTFAADLDEQWEIVLNLIEQAPEDENVLGNLAAGPLEGLLGRFDEEAIDRVEEKAAHDPRFRRVLSGVWQHGMSDTTWKRVQAIQRTEPDPLPAYHKENDKNHTS